MVEQAQEEMIRLRTERQRSRTNLAPDSSMPVNPSSETNGHVHQAGDIPDLVLEVETKSYKVKPFGLAKSFNMRELNPNGEFFDQLVLYKAERWVVS